jgi:hypothetical protein
LEYSKSPKQKPSFSSRFQLEPAKESSPKPKNQPKTSPSLSDGERGEGLVFVTKFHCKYGLNRVSSGTKTITKIEKKTKENNKVTPCISQTNNTTHITQALTQISLKHH